MGMETSTAQLLKVSVDGPVATLTMDRPRQRNALSMALMGEIVAALGELRERRDVRAVVLAGEGPAFCAGHDLGEMAGLDERQAAVRYWKRAIEITVELDCSVIVSG